MPRYFPFGSRRHVNLKILDLIVHSQTVPNTPPSFKDSAGHCILIQPTFLVGFHGDTPPRRVYTLPPGLLLLFFSSLNYSLNPQVAVLDTAFLEMFLIVSVT